MKVELGNFNIFRNYNDYTMVKTVMREGSKYLVDGLVATGGDLEVVECSQTTPPDSGMFTGELSLVKNEAGSINQEISEVSGKKVGTNLGSKVVCFLLMVL